MSRLLLLVFVLVTTQLASAERLSVVRHAPAQPQEQATPTQSFDALVYDLSPLLTYEEMAADDQAGGRGRSRGGGGRGGVGVAAAGGMSPISENVHPRLECSEVSPVGDLCSEFRTRIDTGGEWRTNYATYMDTASTGMCALYTSYDETADTDRIRIARRFFNAAQIYYYQTTYDGLCGVTKGDWALKAREYVDRLKVMNATTDCPGAGPTPCDATTITRSGSTMTVDTSTNHNLVNTRYAAVSGCVEPEYNIGGVLTVVDADTFTLAMTVLPAGTTCTGSNKRYGNLLQIVNTGGGDVARLVSMGLDYLWADLSTIEKWNYGPGFLMLGVNESSVSNVWNGVTPVATEAENKWSNNHFVESMCSNITTSLLYKGSGIDDAWVNTVYAYYDVVARGASGWMTLNSTRGDLDGSWVQGNVYGLPYNQITITACERHWRIAHGLARADRYQTTGAGRHIRGYPIKAAYHLRPFSEFESGNAPNDRHPRAFLGTHAAWNGNYDNYGNALQAAGFFWVASELDGVDQDRADLSRWIGENVHYESTNSDWWGLTRFSRVKGTAKSPTTIGLALSKHLTGGEFTWRTGHYNIAALTHAGVFCESTKWIAEDVPMNGACQFDYQGPVIVRPSMQGHDTDAIGRLGSGNLMSAVNTAQTTLLGNFSGLYDDLGGPRNYQNTPLLLNSGGSDLRDYLDLSLFKFLGVGQNDADEPFGMAYLDLGRSYNSDVVNDNSVTALTQIWSQINRMVVVVLPATPGTDSLFFWNFDFGTLEATTQQKRVSYHTGASTPTLDGTCTANTPVRNGSGANKTRCTSPTLFTVANSTSGHNNKLFLRFASSTCTLEGVKVNWRTGSPTTNLEDHYGRTVADTQVAGRSLVATGPSDAGAPSFYYASLWREEIICPAGNLTDRIVSYGEIVPSSTGSESAKLSILGTAYEGARQGQFVAMRATVNGTTAGSFTLPTSVTNGVLLIANPTVTSTAYTWSLGAGITAMTRTADGVGATTGATSSSVGTLQLTFTTNTCVSSCVMTVN